MPSVQAEASGLSCYQLQQDAAGGLGKEHKECKSYQAFTVSWQRRFVPGVGAKAEGAAKLDASKHKYLPQAEAKPEVRLSLQIPEACISVCLNPNAAGFSSHHSYSIAWVREVYTAVAGAYQPGASRASSARRRLSHLAGGCCRGAGCCARCGVFLCPSQCCLQEVPAGFWPSKQHAF